MRNMFCYEIRTTEDDYRVEIIKAGNSGIFFDTSFIEEEKGLLKCYADVSGHAAISSYVEMPMKTAVSITIGILKGMIDAMDRFILPWDYIISTKTVYADRKGEGIKFIYVPVKDGGRPCSAADIMLSFVKEFIYQISEDAKEEFDELIAIFSAEGIVVDDCLRRLYELRSRVIGALDLC